MIEDNFNNNEFEFNINLENKTEKIKKYDYLKYAQDPLTSQNCRNAVSGAYYPFKNGSSEVMNLYCIRDCTGVNYKNEVRKDPVNCFYDNPEQFENHRKITLNKNLKDKWYKRQVELKSNKN